MRAAADHGEAKLPGPCGRPPPAPLISVCVLAGHSLEQLEDCLTSLRSQVDAPAFELLVGEASADAMRLVRRHFPDAQICRSSRRLPSAARNPLVERARGELLLFLDDDVTAPPDLLRTLAETAARHPAASVFGGPNETPPQSTRFQVVQGAVLSSLMGAGPVSRRYGARNPGPADERWFTLCNLAIRRRVMAPFASHLVCAEENALLAELRGRRELMRYDPALRVFHVRRPSATSFAAQMFKYGRGRGQLMSRQPRTTRAAYLGPPVFLAYLLLIPAMIAALGGGPGLLALVPGALYGILATLSALRIGWTLRSLAVVPMAATLILTVHLCYGAGVLRGLLAPTRRRAPEQVATEWHAPTSLAGEAAGAPAGEGT